MPTTNSPPIIDVEASGFGAGGYPIEVGVALDDGTKYCTLILPAPDWTHWDDDAEKVHRISRDILETYGRPLVDVAQALNELLAGKTVYSDGWVVDKPWLTTLFHAAGVPLQFGVSPLEAILSEPQMAGWHAAKDAVIADLGVARHRASLDAWVIQETYRRTRTATGTA
ncbi:MAG: 3'-5' exonuclease [Gammaproteobacteria bacterium]